MEADTTVPSVCVCVGGHARKKLPPNYSLLYGKIFICILFYNIYAKVYPRLFDYLRGDFHPPSIHKTKTHTNK